MKLSPEQFKVEVRSGGIGLIDYDPVVPLVVNRQQAMAMLSCSYVELSRLLKAGEIEGWIEKVGAAKLGRRKVLVASIKAYIERHRDVEQAKPPSLDLTYAAILFLRRRYVQGRGQGQKRWEMKKVPMGVIIGGRRYSNADIISLARKHGWHGGDVDTQFPGRRAESLARVQRRKIANAKYLRARRRRLKEEKANAKS